MVFGGDVLFNGSIGRTDLPGGDFPTLMSTIQTQFLSLPDSTVVHSGHGPDTTIGVERLTNPFLAGSVTGMSRAGDTAPLRGALRIPGIGGRYALPRRFIGPSRPAIAAASRSRPGPWAARIPARNCGTVYPLGDCSD